MKRVLCILLIVTGFAKAQTPADYKGALQKGSGISTDTTNTGNLIRVPTNSNVAQPMSGAVLKQYFQTGLSTKAHADSIAAGLINTAGFLKKNMAGSSASPTVTLAAAAGTGATYSIVGNNTSGIITFTTGVSLLAIGKVLTLNFANSQSYTNGCVVLFSSGNSAFALASGRLYITGNATTADLYVITTALSVSTTYVGYYQILGY